MSDTHALQRTSPKGQPFVGTCYKCGRTGLPWSAVKEECTNLLRMTQEDALLAAIQGDVIKDSGDA
jgi:hypothetical protein